MYPPPLRFGATALRGSCVSCRHIFSAFRPGSQAFVTDAPLQNYLAYAASATSVAALVFVRTHFSFLFFFLSFFFASLLQRRSFSLFSPLYLQRIRTEASKPTSFLGRLPATGVRSDGWDAALGRAPRRAGHHARHARHSRPRQHRLLPSKPHRHPTPLALRRPSLNDRPVVLKQQQQQQQHSADRTHRPRPPLTTLLAHSGPAPTLPHSCPTHHPHPAACSSGQVVYAAMNYFSTSACQMDVSVSLGGSTFQINASMLNAADCLAIIIVVPILDR